MNWLFLILAGSLEILVVVSIKKLANKNYTSGLPLYILSLSSSIFFLYLAMREIDISVAYAAYTGIGVVGTLTTGVIFWGDTITLKKFSYLFLLTISIIILKFSS
ncbi:SMR family transporter [Pectobacterium aroidearum]|uniref:DMT family transporter n=1 Tax=Pectobacterium aroidearum TaxID=1201031 RepID=UPI003158A2F9